jgi:hypothetical protein
VRVTAGGAGRWAIGLLVAVGPLATAGASAAAPPAAPGWSISSISEPTSFSPGDTARCQEFPLGTPPGSSPCDSFRVVVRNVGAQATDSSPVVISDALPPGLTLEGIAGEEQQAGAASTPLTCISLPVQCTYEAPVPAGGALYVTINVAVEAGAPGPVTNSASVAGGGAPPASTSAPTTPPTTLDGSPAPFGITNFDLRVDGPDGTPDTQAADHPYAVTTTFDLTSATRKVSATGNYKHLPVQQLKDLTVDLPVGLVGDPQAAPRCALSSLLVRQAEVPACPTASQLGTVTFEGEGSFRSSGVTGLQTSSLYNMIPEKGHPAEFGFAYLGQAIYMYASVVPEAGGYALQISLPGLDGVNINGVSLTFFGDPATQDASGNPPVAFFTNPANCAAGPLTASLEANSWEDSGRIVRAEASVYPQLTGCNMLQFAPAIEVTPEGTQADEPAGYGLNVHIPQAPSFAPELATPELKAMVLTLPAGVSVSPASADGLAGCGDPQFALSSGEPATCPSASQVGSVQIETPLLADPLEGQVYLGTPNCGPCTGADAEDGQMLRLLIQAEGSGMVIKLRGTVSADPTTGQLQVTLDDVPQIPFTDLRLRLKGGPRALLANPEACGAYTAVSDLDPWSAPGLTPAGLELAGTPMATASSSFAIDWDGSRGACPAEEPFTPTFTAGVTATSAGGFSPFTMTLTRGDRQQQLSGLSATLPPGLLAQLSQVSRCPEPEASSGACPASSRIGATTVGAGAGSHPLYLSGPYRGAPFGLSIAVPVQAGPLNLGTIVIRAAIAVSAIDAHLTITTDPLPQIAAGVPLRLQTLSVILDRAAFTFNPTNCAQQRLAATITSAQGTSVGLASPFAVANCDKLPFKPRLTALTHKRISSARGAGLHVVITSGAGQANLRSVAITLPSQLPARLATVQKACRAQSFDQSPATCPSGSLVGTATVATPFLSGALSGPVYLVSHGGKAFPNLVLILRDEGVSLRLSGLIRVSKHQVVSAAFNSIPDVPIRRFDLVLPEGPHSALAAGGRLCTKALTTPVTMTAQNGARITQTTTIAVAGCPKRAQPAKH